MELYAFYIKHICSLMLLVAFISCSGQPINIAPKNEEDILPNTKIVVHFRNQRDREDEFHTKFQQYENFALADYTIVAPPGFVLKEDGLSRSYLFHLDSPALLNIGFHVIYVTAGDSVDVSYEMLGKDKDQAPLESIVFNTPNSFLFLRNGRSTFSSVPNEIAVYKMKGLKDIDKYFRLKHIDSLSTQYTQNIFANNPRFKPTDERRAFVYQLMVQNNFNDIVTAFTERLSYFTAKEQTEGRNKLLQIYKTLSNRLTYKRYFFYVSTKKMYKLIYEPKWVNKAFEIGVINADTRDYDTLTRQYFLLLTLKNNLAEVRKSNENMAKINVAITNPVLRQYADKYLSLKIAGKTDDNYLTNELRNVPVYNVSLQEIPFGEIFKNTQQPYLYFDFCGSWCIPCLNEISEYAQSDRIYDHSEKVRPIWLFFENNQKEWLKVIEKYHLNKKNCFLVMDKKLQNIFTPQFGWLGEFPHHFLFSKEGRLINPAASPLINLKENELALEKNIPALVPPSTPPSN